MPLTDVLAAEFETLVTTQRGWLTSVARKHLGSDPEEAADAVQTAVAKAWVALPHFRHQATMRTWLATILVHVCLDARRRHAYGPEFLSADEEAEWGDDLADPAGDVAGEVVGRDTLRRVAAAVDACGRHGIHRPYLRAVVARDLDGKTYEDAAGGLGVSVNTFKAQLWRGRQHLRALLLAEESVTDV
jgi:RNA polymerase sigma-70 factor (ECF subfamily)